MAGDFNGNPVRLHPIDMAFAGLYPAQAEYLYKTGAVVGNALSDIGDSVAKSVDSGLDRRSKEKARKDAKAVDQERYDKDRAERALQAQRDDDRLLAQMLGKQLDSAKEDYNNQTGIAQLAQQAGTDLGPEFPQAVASSKALVDKTQSQFDGVMSRLMGGYSSQSLGVGNTPEKIGTVTTPQDFHSAIHGDRVIGQVENPSGADFETWYQQHQMDPNCPECKIQARALYDREMASQASKGMKRGSNVPEPVPLAPPGKAVPTPVPGAKPGAAVATPVSTGSTPKEKQLLDMDREIGQVEKQIYAAQQLAGKASKGGVNSAALNTLQTLGDRFRLLQGQRDLLKTDITADKELEKKRVVDMNLRTDEYAQARNFMARQTGLEPTKIPVEVYEGVKQAVMSVPFGASAEQFQKAVEKHFERLAADDPDGPYGRLVPDNVKALKVKEEERAFRAEKARADLEAIKFATHDLAQERLANLGITGRPARVAELAVARSLAALPPGTSDVQAREAVDRVFDDLAMKDPVFTNLSRGALSEQERASKFDETKLSAALADATRKEADVTADYRVMQKQAEDPATPRSLKPTKAQLDAAKQVMEDARTATRTASSALMNSQRGRFGAKVEGGVTPAAPGMAVTEGTGQLPGTAPVAPAVQKVKSGAPTPAELAEWKRLAKDKNGIPLSPDSPEGEAVMKQILAKRGK